MADIIVTGASRGIGRALASALGKREDTRLFLLARDANKLREVAAECRDAHTLTGDLGCLNEASALGARLAAQVLPGAVLIHNAGLWPARCELTADGLERAYAINHAGPVALQLPLLAAGKLGRVMVVSAGLIAAGRFDPARTPNGADFSSFRTYASTKRGFAQAVRELAPEHPEVDFVVLHPGVVRTDLGARGGVMGWLLSLVKRGWEAPETCAQRLTRLLDVPRWSPPGQASWYFEDKPAPWPI